MKILLDECVTKKLKPFFSEHSVSTVSEMKWNGLLNGELIKKAIEEDFNLLITIDKNISSQQNIRQYKFIIVIFDSPSSNISSLKKFIPLFEKKSASFQTGNVYVISLNN